MKGPSGFIHLLSAPGGVPDPLDNNQFLTQDNIAGFRWRTGWENIQPDNAAAFDWGPIDDAIAICTANDKIMGISISAGRDTPAWVYDTAPTLDRFAFDPANEVGNMAYPWQLPYLAKWQAFVSAFGAIYDSNPVVKYVIATGWQQVTTNFIAKTDDEETRLTAQAVADGYADLREAMDFAAQNVIGYWMQAFPMTSVLLTDGGTWPSDGGPGNWRDTMRKYMPLTYPEHGGWMTAELRATVAPWPPPAPKFQWPHGFQAYSPFANLNGIYNGMVPDPPPVPPQIMNDFCNHGYSNNAQFLEIYGADLALQANQSVIDSFLPKIVTWLDESQVSVPISVPLSIPGISTPVTSAPPVPGDIVQAPTVRIITCKTGTHARNIILGHKRMATEPDVVPIRPGPVEIINVVTPNEPSSGQATATWLSPKGFDAAKLTYRAYVTGGPGTVTIVSTVPV